MQGAAVTTLTCDGVCEEAMSEQTWTEQRSHEETRQQQGSGGGASAPTP